MNFKKALGATLLAGAIVCATAIGGKPYKDTRRVSDNESNYTQSNTNYGPNPKSSSYFVAGEYDSGAKIVKVNRGAFVSGKDPSLTGLVSKLTSESDSREVKAQKLLDYVSGINYNPNEDSSNKTALEVLSTGSADCRGKAVLYSSLLGNVGIDNVIVYFPTHLSVAVEGNHPNQNGLAFDLDGKRYSIAEPCTENGFEIGRTESSQLDFNKIEQIQRSDGKIFDVKTGKELPFY
ncbi:MAG: transglutaminase-like domain-containing protein [Nanoarchaeota archaeon]|mgnify:CR=1 FL=1